MNKIRYALYKWFIKLAYYSGGAKNPLVLDSVRKAQADLLERQKKEALHTQPSPNATPKPKTSAPEQGVGDPNAQGKIVVSDFTPEGIAKSLLSMTDPCESDTQQNIISVLGDVIRLSNTTKSRTRLRLACDILYEDGVLKGINYKSNLMMHTKFGWVVKHSSAIPMDRADLYVREFAAFMDGLGWVNSYDAEKFYKEGISNWLAPVIKKEAAVKTMPGELRKSTITHVLTFYTADPNNSDDTPQIISTVAAVIDGKNHGSVSSAITFNRQNTTALA